MNIKELEILNEIVINDSIGANAKRVKSKELLKYLLEQNKYHDFYKYLIWALNYEDTLNDYICEYMDINNCFPPEDE